jgi:hypothetical protein
MQEVFHLDVIHLNRLKRAKTQEAKDKVWQSVAKQLHLDVKSILPCQGWDKSTFVAEELQ